MCARHTTTSGKYVFPTRNLHWYLWSLTYNSTVKDIFRSISVEIWTDLSLRKAQRAWCFSPCEGSKTVISCQTGMKRLLVFVLTVQRMVTCTYHLNPPAAISIYGWRYQAKHYCAYADGLPCLFCLRAPPFTLKLKQLHPCVSFWETIYKNALQQVLCKFWFIYYQHSSKSFEKYWFRNYVYLIHQRNTMKRKVLVKQTDSFKVKFDKNVILKYICTSIFCLLFWRWST